MSTLDNAISVAASALRAERVRIETSVSNIANAETTRGADGQPYRRKDVVLTSEPMRTFDSMLGAAEATGVRVAQVVEDQQPFDRRYQPNHPDADEDGYISLPNVNPAEEMVDMLGATRAYQANLAAVGLIRDLMNRALDLGKA